MIPKKTKKQQKVVRKPTTEGGGEIDMLTLFAAELVVWWRQLAQMWDLVIRNAKNEHTGPPKAQKKSPGPKKTQKILPGSWPKQIQRSTRARKITRGNKNTTERHNRAAGSPKT